MNLIVCVDKFWGIGKNNCLLFHLPEDLKYFKEKTLGKTVVMGGNTLLSLPGSKPLPNRKNIVLSDAFTRDDCECYSDLDTLKNRLKELPGEDLFIIGGAMFYKTMLPFCETAYITKVDADGEADCFFDNLDHMGNWKQISVSDEVISNGKSIRYTVYKNLAIKNL